MLIYLYIPYRPSAFTTMGEAFVFLQQQVTKDKEEQNDVYIGDIVLPLDTIPSVIERWTVVWEQEGSTLSPLDKEYISHLLIQAVQSNSIQLIPDLFQFDHVLKLQLLKESLIQKPMNFDNIMMLLKIGGFINDPLSFRQFCDCYDYDRYVFFEVILQIQPLNFSLVEFLLKSGVSTNDSNILGHFFQQHDRDECTFLLDKIFEITQVNREDSISIYCIRRAQRHMFCQGLIKMVLSPSMRFEKICHPPFYEYIPTWTTYRFMTYFLQRGVCIKDFWRARNYWFLPIDCSVLCLVVRTTLHTTISLHVLHFIEIIVHWNMRFQSSDDANDIDIIKNIFHVLLLCGVTFHSRQFQRVKHLLNRKFHPEPKGDVICAELASILPLSLFQSCRAVLQRHLRGPNMLYSLIKTDILPESIKRKLLLDNLPEVWQLEHGPGVREDANNKEIQMQMCKRVIYRKIRCQF